MSGAFTLVDAARDDLRQVFAWTLEQFGEMGLRRYRLLIEQAISDIAEDPERVGVKFRPELFRDARSYHLHWSKDHVAKAHRVKKPRHILLFWVNSTNLVEIAGVFHDSMELSQHLPR